jgi:hypothetical protein
MLFRFPPHHSSTHSSTFTDRQEILPSDSGHDAILPMGYYQHLYVSTKGQEKPVGYINPSSGMFTAMNESMRVLFSEIHVRSVNQ